MINVGTVIAFIPKATTMPGRKTYRDGLKTMTETSSTNRSDLCNPHQTRDCWLPLIHKVAYNDPIHE